MICLHVNRAELPLPVAARHRLLPLTQSAPPGPEATEFIDWSARMHQVGGLWVGACYWSASQDVHTWSKSWLVCIGLAADCWQLFEFEWCDRHASLARTHPPGEMQHQRWFAISSIAKSYWLSPGNSPRVRRWLSHVRLCGDACMDKIVRYKNFSLAKKFTCVFTSARAFHVFSAS